MPGLDNKISNIIGTAIPTWLLKQFEARSNKNTQSSRDTQNVLYLSNKTAWIRLVSSINITKTDITYFNNNLGLNITDPSDLAKNYVLFGGTSKYRPAEGSNQFGYDLRSGIQKDGVYNLFGDEEVKNYGYRPMPGITNVAVETQGVLGSIRGATINFKVWDKNQLDVIDALYFKLGFSMFLEWGQTYFYHSERESPNIDPNKLYSTEEFSIDPFQQNLTKEEILYQISLNTRNAEGNYDAMLGIVTNFNFTYNQEGGFDCSLKLMSLGYLGDMIKINHPRELPDILEAEIKQLNSITKQIEDAKTAKEIAAQDAANAEQLQKDLEGRKSILEVLYKASGTTPSFQKEPQSVTDNFQVLNAFGLASSKLPAILPGNEAASRISEYDFLGDLGFGKGTTLYSLKYGVQVPQNNTAKYISAISLDGPTLRNILFQDYNKYLSTFSSDSTQYRKTLEEYIISSGRGKVSQSTSNSNKYNEYIEVKDIDTLGYKYNLVYTGNNGKTYSLTVQIQLPYQNPATGKIITYADRNGVDQRDKLAALALSSILKQDDFNFTPTNFTFTPYKVIGQNENATVSAKDNFYLEFRGVYPINVEYDKSVATTTTDVTVKDSSKANAKFTVTINDTNLISNIQPNTQNPEILFTDYIKKLNAQNQQQTQLLDEENPDLYVNPNQVDNAIKYMSSLEIILRTIQVHSLSTALEKAGSDIKKEVYPVKLYEEYTGKKKLVDQIFSTGILSPFLTNLINNTISETDYPKSNRMEVFAKYGFNTALLGNKLELKELKGKQVDYKALLTSYVIPYEINQTIVEGTVVNHPVYIQLGTLLMIINHMCTIYDTKDGANSPKDQSPLVYIDYNPETNFCLSTNQHLSTDPLNFLIPFEGSFDDYKSLFDKVILDGNNIKGVGEDKEPTKLFNPREQDALSGQIPKFKYDEKTAGGTTAYRGKIMKVLLSVDYILQLVKTYSQKNDTNNVYLKPFLEQIISDLNRSLGNFNTLRLAYNDAGNTFHIVDDQLVPGDENEDFISPDNKDEIPLFGLKSIAKTLEIKTDISTRLSNMIAISANSNPAAKATLSTNSTDFGFINTGYKDRYINNRLAIGGSGENDVQNNNVNATLINAAIRFNQTIADFYSTVNPSNDNIGQAINYYIERMSKIKAADQATRASAMIPVSVNFTTDGISGMNIGQGFTIPEQFLPYTYNARTITGIGTNNIQKVGFVVLGIQHMFEANQWNTAIRANMIFLKRKSDFDASKTQDKYRKGKFGISESNAVIDNVVSYANFKTPVTNPRFLGVTQKDVVTGGPIEQAVFNAAQSIFNTIKSYDKNISIEVTSGNDKFHQGRKENSYHKVGQAIDFTITPATEQNKALVESILKSYKDKDPNFNFLNEYEVSSKNKTGDHFHINYKS